MEAMLVNVALTGKRAGMEPKAISSKADSYYYHYYSFFSSRNCVQILSTDQAKATLRFSADFTFMKTCSEEKVGEELFFLTLGS